MGIWGTGLYQNDTALDIKDIFEERFSEGKTAQEITDILKEEYKSIMEDYDEACIFWMTLADVQWDFGVLLSSVKEKALCFIEKEINSPKYNDSKYIQELNVLRLKLLSPQPPKKKIVKRRIYKCPWNIGDVFAYRMESDLAKEKGLYGRYLLIQKVDEATWHPGHIIPIVYVKLTNDNTLPSDLKEYNNSKYIQTNITRYEERFWPIDMTRPKEDIAEKSKKIYELDEYGFLPQYRTKIITTSKKAIPTKLIYLGNFSEVNLPKKEFVPHSKINIKPVPWEKLDKTFESEMINSYCLYNLRESLIYKNTNKQ